MALIPEYRHEQFLDAIVNSTTPPSSAYRIELFLSKIAGEAVTLPTPVNRTELYLAKIAGENVTVPAPVTRLEMYLAAIAGEAVTPPDPEYRIEQWLYDWSQGGGQSELKYAAGSSPLTLANAVARLISTLTRMGTAEQATTPTPSAPVDIVCNNGAVRYGALGDNLFDPNPSAITLGWYIAANNGQVLESRTNFLVPQYIPVVGGEKYVFYGRHKTNGRVSSYNRIAFYSADKTYISTGSYTKDEIGTGTAPLNAAYARLSCNLSGESAATGTPVTYETIADYNWTFTQAVAEIPYEPFVGGIYTDGTPEVLSVNSQTASVADLFGTAASMDEHEIISGTVKRKYGLKVLDGTETINTSNACFTVAISGKVTSKSELLCSHFPYSTKTSSQTEDMTIISFASSNVGFRYDACTDKTAFATYLATQYAAGTPVIVMYPLATEETESVAPQALRTENGTNTVTATAPEVDQTNTMMVVTYYGEA